MDRLVLSVVRRDGGWAVEHERQAVATYRHQEEAIARARLLGHTLWDRGHPCEVTVEEVTGRTRSECAYGADSP